MLTRRKRLAISLVLAALLALPPVALAQEATAQTQEWSNLKTITPGSKLDVRLKNKKRVKGKLISISDTALSLSDRDKPAEINQDDVLSVHQMSGMTAKKATLIGTGAGAAIGAGLGAAGSSGNHILFSRSQDAALVGVIGAVVGAIAGLVVGKIRHKRALIYQAKQP